MNSPCVIAKPKDVSVLIFLLLVWVVLVQCLMGRVR